MKKAESIQETIYRKIKERILGGGFPSSRLPSDRGLATKYSVSRSTLTRVLTDLEREGLVTRRQGSGTFVTKKGKSRKIGLLVPETACSEYFTRIVSEISRHAQRESYTLLFVDIFTKDLFQRATQAEEIARQFVEQGASGVIFSPIEFLSESEAINRRILATFDRANVPVVLCDCDFAPYPVHSSYDVVGTDNIAAGAEIYDYLYSLGARKIHFHTLPHTAQSHQDRLRGVIAACLQKRGTWSERNEFIGDPYDIAAVRRHLKRSRPDAIICGNDNLAAMLDQTLAKLGRRVPEDILVTGFNDVSIARLATPTITTQQQPCEQIAETALQRLLERMNGKQLPATRLLLPARLIPRESTKRTTSSKKGKNP